MRRHPACRRSRRSSMALWRKIETRKAPSPLLRPRPVRPHLVPPTRRHPIPSKPPPTSPKRLRLPRSLRPRKRAFPQMRTLPTRYPATTMPQLRLTQPCLQARRSISRTLRTRTIATPRSRVPFPRAIPCGQMSMTKRTGRNTPSPTPARGRMPGWRAPRTRRRSPTTLSWSGSRKALPSPPTWPANTSSAR